MVVTSRSSSSPAALEVTSVLDDPWLALLGPVDPIGPPQHTRTGASSTSKQTSASPGVRSIAVADDFMPFTGYYTSKSKQRGVLQHIHSCLSATPHVLDMVVKNSTRVRDYHYSA